MVPNHLYASPRHHFVVLYCVGGTDNAEWRATVTTASGARADRMASDIRIGGRAAYVRRVADVVDIGMPEGFRAP